MLRAYPHWVKISFELSKFYEQKTSLRNKLVPQIVRNMKLYEKELDSPRHDIQNSDEESVDDMKYMTFCSVCYDFSWELRKFFDDKQFNWMCLHIYI